MFAWQLPQNQFALKILDQGATLLLRSNITPDAKHYM